MIHPGEGCAPDFNLDERKAYQDIEELEKDRAQAEEVPAYYRRRSAGVWASIATLTVAFVVVVTYGYAVLRQQEVQIEQIPGMTKSLPPFSQHLASLERRLEAGRTDQQNLTVQVQKIDAGSRATLALARQQTDVLTSHVQQSMLQEQRKQSAVLQNQVSQLASDRNSDRQRLTQVQEQLAQAHQELEMARMDYTRELDALREQQGMENRELASLSNSLSTRQVSFRVQKNKLAAIIPGVSFQLTKIDVRHQRFDGLIESASANQKVSVQSQGVRSPIVFFPSAHGRAFLLVVTKVDDMGAVGYLLLPAAKTDQRDFVSATGNPLSPALELPGNESRVSEP